MKKVIAGLLAAVLCMGLSVGSFAATSSDTTEQPKVKISKVSFKEKGTFTVDGKKVTATIYHMPDNATIVVSDSKGLISPDELYIYEWTGGTSFKLTDSSKGTMGPVSISGNALVKYGNTYCTANKGKLWEDAAENTTSQKESISKKNTVSTKDAAEKKVVSKKKATTSKKETTSKETTKSTSSEKKTYTVWVTDPKTGDMVKKDVSMTAEEYAKYNAKSNADAKKSLKKMINDIKRMPNLTAEDEATLAELERQYAAM